MPQMAPLPWITLLVLTIFILLYISTIIFFSFKMNPIKTSKKYNTKFMIKW